MTRLNLAILGPFQARRETGHVVAIRRRKAQALLAYLALRRGEAQPRERLIALLWEGLDPAHARHSLRQTLTELRQDLGARSFPALVLDGDALALDQTKVTVDVTRFERLAASASAEDLREAAAMYRGDLLEGAPGGGETFEAWLAGERDRVRTILVDALDRLLRCLARAGSPLEAQTIAARLLSIDPCREDVHRSLMRLQAAAGRRSAALRQYRSCVAVLQRELEIPPEPETTSLYRAIRDGRLGVSGTRRAPLAEWATLPFIGRGPEMERLSADLAAAWDGAGRAVLVHGPAGIGKSRLVEELARRAGARGGRVLIGRAHESEQVLPFGLWVSLLHEAQVTGEPDLLAGLRPGERRTLSGLLPEADRDRREPDPVSITRLFGASHALLLALAARGPIAVVLEDLHWADEMSIRLLGFLARRTGGARLFLVGTTRDEDRAANPVLTQVLAEATRDDSVEEIALGPLGRDAAGALARSLLRRMAIPDVATMVQKMWELSEGNPLILVESARSLRAGQIIDGAEPLPVPRSVKDLVRGRLSRLDHRARMLLDTAAAIGHEFEPPLVREALGWSALEVGQHLGELLRRQFLQERGGRLDFAHERVRDVVHESLASPERQALHGQVAAALERLHADDLRAVATRLAAHCRDAHAWDRAARYYSVAADVAAGRSAYAAAEGLLREALRWAERIDSERLRIERVVDLHLDFERVLTPQGNLSGLLEHLREAESGARSIGDRRRLAWAAVQRIFCGWWSGDPEAAQVAGDQAMAIAASLGDRTLGIVSRHHLAQLYFHLGEYRRGVEVCREALAALADDSTVDFYGQAVAPAVQCRVYLSACLGGLGEVATAREIGLEAVQTAERADHRFSIAFASYALGNHELGRGRLDAACRWLERAMDLQGQLGQESRFLSAGGALGLAYVHAGRLHEGVALIEQATRASSSQGLRYAHQRNLGCLAYARLHEGRIAEALQCAEEALVLARQQRQRVAEVRVLHLLAQILAAAPAPGIDRIPEAVARCRDALALAQELKLDVLIGRCQETLTSLLQRHREANRVDASRAIA